MVDEKKKDDQKTDKGKPTPEPQPLTGGPSPEDGKDS